MILIADSGSTKTDWCFVEKNKEPIWVKTAGINPYYQSEENILLEVEKALRTVYDGYLEAVYYYGTGITGPSVAEQIHGVISKIYPDCGEISVSSDLIAAAKALYGNKKGIAVILGTGANSGLFNGVGISEQIAPLGFWLGDEGSGGYLGKLLITAYLQKELSQETIDLFHKEFGEKSRLEILENAYQKPFPNRYFAGFARFVIENKTLSDCQKIIDQSLDRLFEIYLLKYNDIKSNQVGFVGSIAFYLQKEIEANAKKHGIILSKIIKSPMTELIDFHGK